MATVNKDFKIKSGLIVEGLQGTINNKIILTEDAGDQYILDLIGGETLVKSVSNQFDVSAGGELSLDRAVVDAYYDAAGSADSAETAANTYTDNRETAITTAYQNYADQAELDAVSTANAYTDTAEGREQTNRNNAISNAISDLNLPNTYDAKGAAAQALSDAEDYADAKINDASSASDKSWSAYKTGTEIGLAQAAAELHADNAVAALVNGAPAVLDTLNELAEALQDNPDIISDLQGIAAGKQDELTAGANINITGATISVTGLDSADISDFNTAALSATSAAYDAAGSAATAQGNAEDYADGLAVNYDAAGAAATAEQNAKDYADALTTSDVAEGTAQYFTDARAKSSAANLLTNATLTNITITGTGAGLTITAENGVADSTTTDLAEGTNLYFTDERAVDALEAVVPNFTAVEVNSVAKQVASTMSAASAGAHVGHAFAKADYRSAEFLVKVAYGSHTEISKVLLTLDASDNIAMTEYGIVGTNGTAMSVSANVNGANVQLLVTTTNNNSTVTVVGTLLA
jgi:hypothetical protein